MYPKINSTLYVVLVVAYSTNGVDVAWRSGSVIDCHVTARGSIPVGNGVKTSFTSFARDIKWGRRL